MMWPVAIPALPAVAFVALIALPRAMRNRAKWVSVAAIACAAALSVAAVMMVWPSGEKHAEVGWNLSWHLCDLAGGSVQLGLQLDPIAAVLLLTVTFVGTCVQVYSLGYMQGEQREGWYFAVLSLFTAAMLTLVMADTLLLVFAMWELMGLCSYLLIGFWFEQEGPRKASQKAFLTTRVGDLGFLFALFVIFGATGTWELSKVLSSAPTWAPGVAAAAAIGLLLGAMGKSAQVPLHVWLPDAMAGPTPASALIHAATMVAAGVYLVARTLPIFEAAPDVLHATLIVGAITAVVGGLLAAVQHDIKKVLAYSTISQLGLMFMALGAASVVASLFHLVTHAFFKSLLFLGAGAIIHSARTQDMREMGGLRRRMPATWFVFVVGSLGLVGVMPLSGFFSKDEIVAALLRSGDFWAVGVLFVASALTAFYMTRLYFRVFEGPEQSDNMHEATGLMLAPMVALAAVTLVLGFVSPTFAAFLGHEGKWPTIGLIAVSTGVAAFGIANGWWAFGRRSTVKNTGIYKQRLGLLYTVFERKLYFDTVYQAVFIRPYMIAAGVLARFDRSGIDGVVDGAAHGWVAVTAVAGRFDGAILDRAVNGVAYAWVAATAGAQRFDDRVVDGLVNGIAWVSRRAGENLRRLQTGRLQEYQRLVLSAVVLFMLLVVFYVVAKGA
jgi:NADH-quinone oxidoreductase subunit L